MIVPTQDILLRIAAVRVAPEVVVQQRQVYSSSDLDRDLDLSKVARTSLSPEETLPEGTITNVGLEAKRFRAFYTML